MLVANLSSEEIEIQRRRTDRFAFVEPVLIQSDKATLHAASVNISKGGMCLRVSSGGVVRRGDGIAVFIRDCPPVDAKVNWTRRDLAGVRFDQHLSSHPKVLRIVEDLKAKGNAGTDGTGSRVDRMLPSSLHDMLRAEKPPETRSPAQADPVQQRRQQRYDFTDTCWLRTNKRTFQARGQNISTGGICVKLAGLGIVHDGAAVDVILPGGFSPIPGVVRWSKDRVVGVQFNGLIADHPVLRSLQ